MLIPSRENPTGQAAGHENGGIRMTMRKKWKRAKANSKAQSRGRSLHPVIRLHNPPSEKALMSMWLRLNKWCDYHKIETVIVEGGFEWECQIGYVKSRSPSLLRAIAETHRKVQSIHRHQQKPNPNFQAVGTL